MNLRIGFSSCFFHADPKRPLFKGKTLLYLEQSLAQWVMSEGVLGYLVPSLGAKSVGYPEIVRDLDGLILQGGADVAPATYGETAIKPEWAGDSVRDQYEITLVRECLTQNRPILGICRGAQVLNVAFGGTLYQDIASQVPQARVHRNWELYDQIFHEITLEKDSMLARLFPGKKLAKINTVHHQAIKDLGKGLRVEARSTEDGIPEGVSLVGDRYALALQWHPEFHAEQDKSLLDGKVILRSFLDECRKRKGT